MARDLDWLPLLISVVVCSIMLFAFLQVMIHSYNSARSIGSSGSITTGDYLKADLSFIDWGVLIPDQNKTVELVLTNIAPKAQALAMSARNWKPANASDFISLSWNYSGSPLAAKSSIPLAFTIHIDPLISGIYNFTFDIHLTGVEL